MWARRTIQQLDDLSDTAFAAVMACASLVTTIVLAIALLA
jgi:hypothetical protein